MNLTDYNEVKSLLDRHNFRFSRSMGQNFLIEDWVPEAIADSAHLTKDCSVVEVGPGIGCLTRELSSRAGTVTSYELDRTLMPVLAETLTGCENTEVVFRDFMKEQNVRADRFVANIPYNITSPLITKVIQMDFPEIVIMIQKEVAKRICAGAGDPDYSSFGILCQWYTQPEILFDVGPECFTPRPKVTSSVLRMVKRDHPPVEVQDEKLMFSLVRAAFNQRRKTFVNAASGSVSGNKELLSSVLADLHLDLSVRGERLAVEDFAAISDALTAFRKSDSTGVLTMLN